MEDTLRVFNDTRITPVGGVLILVIMEDTLRELKTQHSNAQHFTIQKAKHPYKITLKTCTF